MLLAPGRASYCPSSSRQSRHSTHSCHFRTSPSRGYIHIKLIWHLHKKICLFVFVYCFSATLPIGLQRVGASNLAHQEIAGDGGCSIPRTLFISSLKFGQLRSHNMVPIPKLVDKVSVNCCYNVVGATERPSSIDCHLQPTILASSSNSPSSNRCGTHAIGITHVTQLFLILIDRCSK